MGEALEANKRAESRARSRLMQIPLFLPAEIDEAIRALPASFAARADRLRLRLVADDRTWLHVVADACTAEGAALADVLGDLRSRTTLRARDRAWWAIARLSVCCANEIGHVWLSAGGAREAHNTRISEAIARHEARIAEGAIVRSCEAPPAPIGEPRAPAAPGSLEARLAARLLPDGRPWLNLVFASCRAARADFEELLARAPRAAHPQSAVRARAGSWIALRDVYRYSNAEIAHVFQVVPTTVQKAIAAERARVADEAAAQEAVLASQAELDAGARAA